MIAVQVLEAADIVEPDMLCRPLVLTLSGDDAAADKCMYSGIPINNLRWVPVRAVLGPYWWHMSLATIRKQANWNYEVIQTDIALPARHLLKYDRSKVF